MLFTCIKSWFFRNHLANCHQISDDPTVEMWLRVCSNDHAPLTVLLYIIVFFKMKKRLKDDLFISCDDRTGKMLHNICISAVAMSLRWATRGPWASCYNVVVLEWKYDYFLHFRKLFKKIKKKKIEVFAHRRPGDLYGSIHTCAQFSSKWAKFYILAVLEKNYDGLLHFRKL